MPEQQVSPIIHWLPYAKLSNDSLDRLNAGYTENIDIRDKLREAYKRASDFSKDPSTQTGAILLTTGWLNAHGVNEFPLGVKETPERWDRSVNLQYIEHAERNCIYQAAARGLGTYGSTMICPWYACAECARAIIQSGIKRVIGHKACYDKTPERWRASIQIAFAMLEEAGVECLVYDGNIGDITIRFNGEEWQP